MITVYEAHSSFDAKLVQDQLSFEGINSHIMGDLLQGGMGELQAHGLVKLMVDEENLDKSKEIITNWESKIITEKEGGHLLIKMKTSSFTKFLLILFIPLLLIGAYVLIRIVQYFFLN